MYMIHTPTIISRKQVSDTHVSITIRCCDDPLTDQAHSFVVSDSTSPSDLQAWADSKKLLVSTQHAAMLAHIDALDSLT